MTQTANCTIDLDREGRSHGCLSIPVSTDTVPFALLRVPILSLKNGDGPCVLLMAGCHGDEYEGVVALTNLFHDLTPESIRGQVILLPEANAPAVEAGSRISPLDGGNLNRAYADTESTSPTARIARFIETTLLARASLVVDLHSGGGGVAYVPSTMIAAPDNGATTADVQALARVFGLPFCFIVDGADIHPGSLLAACGRLGIASISAELAGGGTVSRAAVDLVDVALRRLLRRAGVLRDIDGGASGGSPPTTLLRRLPVGETIFAPASGIFEPLADLGDAVTAGQPAARIHAVGSPWTAPRPVAFNRDGIVLCRRVPAQTRRGDGLFKLGVSFDSRPRDEA